MGAQHPSPSSLTSLTARLVNHEIGPWRSAEHQKRLVTEPSSKTSRIAAAIDGAIESVVTLSSWSSCGVGRVLVNTNSLTREFFSRSAAGPDSTPWVAATMTSAAPLSNSASAAAQMVPAVSIMSSTRTQTRPLTSPTTSADRMVFAWVMSRRLWMIASGAPSRSDHWSATFTRPASGETMVSFDRSTLRPT